MTKLSREEMETIISWSAGSQTAHLYTSDPKVIRQMARRHPNLCVQTVQFGVEYTFPASWVRLPSESRRQAPDTQISPEKAKARLEALARGREKKKAAKVAG